jgi:phosphatidylserine/phosphatidylglycerophosphate/cardiolipin synthase-like enzyme
MRASARANGVTAMAYAGTTGVLLALDITQRRREGLLGFAFEREGGNRPRHWLKGMLHFPGIRHRPGALVETRHAPIQKFRWSDYRVYPGTTYTYTVHPVYGDPLHPQVAEGPSVVVTTASAEAGEHRVLFNRAAAASQAFSREFPEVSAELDAARREKRDVELPPDALAWLSRGVLEQITGFCQRAADPTWALDVAIYEYELPAIRQAIAAARTRGAEVRIVYHAKPGDEQTGVNEANLADWPRSLKRARVTHKICHDKFIVLSRIDGQVRTPVAVLCGSTNFTANGVYRQANVVHIVERADVGLQYLALFEQLFGGATPAETKKWIDAQNPLSRQGRLSVGFSPRSGEIDLDLFVEEIGQAKRDVLFCTAFDLDDRLEQALLGDPHDDTLRVGLQNTRSAITGFHRDRTARFVATAFLNRGLEGYLKESTAGQKGNILIHTKLIVLNFTSPSPTVISGSHNLSASASSGNDENYLIIRGQPDVADCYGVELMRLYEHYRFRWNASPSRRKQPERENPCPRPAGTLCPDDRWTIPYFEQGSLEALDRERFAHPRRQSR